MANPGAKRPNKRTKIVCTMGPAVANPEKIRALMLAGMDVVRINCSHGEPEERRDLARMVREAAAELDLFVPILFDLQGPKIRIGKLEADIPLTDGQTLTIAVGRELGSGDTVYTSYAGFARDVKAGDQVLIDDGKIRLRATKVEESRVTCVVETGGLLKPRKGINLPQTKISAPCLNDKDLADLALAIELQVDFVAVSFVRGANDMVQVRREANRIGKHELHFVSKIERPEALKELIPIINTSDGVMVARGDLGVEIGSHKVPMYQKEIIARANSAGKFVITATQMLDSMIERPIPTRAEASDVANAILDGTDACMLSGETAAGAHPIEAVEMMVSIAREVEGHSIYRYQPPPYQTGSIHHIPDGVSIAAYQTANLMAANLLVAFTNSGASVLRLAKKHPNPLIVAATANERTARRVMAYWGVRPLLIQEPDTIEMMFAEIREKLAALDMAREGDVAVVTSGYPLSISGSTNLMNVMEI